MPGLGQNIRAIREERGLTREDLAPLIGVTTSTVYRWEKDKSEPSFTRLRKIAAALNCPVADLWPRDEAA